MLKKSIALSLGLLITTSSVLANDLFSKAGMDSCLSDSLSLTKNNYAIIISKDVGSALTSISSFKRGATTLLGRLTPTQVNQIKPELRYLASGGLVVGYIAVGVGAFYAGAAAGSLLALANADAGGVIIGAIAPSATIKIAGGATAFVATSAPQAINTLNTVAQYERGNVEKCLKNSSSVLKPGARVVLKMKNRDDFEDTVGALKDLLKDLKK